MTDAAAGAAQERFLSPGEVAVRLSVDPKTVTRWAKDGLVPFIKLPGGHRRYPASYVDAMCELIQARGRVKETTPTG